MENCTAEWAEQMANDQRRNGTQQEQEEWATEIKNCLRKEINPKLTIFDKSIAFITTPIGKQLLGAFFGWIDMKAEVEIKGHIGQDAKSSDGFTTLDIKLDEFWITKIIEDGEERNLRLNGLPEEDRYIRIEVKKEVSKDKGKDEMPETCSDVKIKGKLMWDRDGFLEVHPQKGEDIIAISTPQDDH